MSLLDGPAQWCAARPLMTAVILTSLVTIPTAFNLEQRMDNKAAKNAERIEEVEDEVDDEVVGTEPTTPGDDEAPTGDGTTSTTGTTQPGAPPTTSPPALEITDEQILRIITEFCQENDCRPIFVDEAEQQEGETQEGEIQEAEIQDGEIQDAEIQEAEIQEPELQNLPVCAAGYREVDIRIPSVSKDKTLTVRVCMRT